MFKNLLSEQPSIIKKIEGDLAEKDLVFDDKSTMEKGIFKETLIENGDVVELIKNFISHDKSYSKTEVIKLDKETFTELVKTDLMSIVDIEKEKAELTIKIGKLANESQFEFCAVIRDRIKILNKMVEIKTK